MLSNKLTFSLVLVLVGMLALAATPALAQLSGALNGVTPTENDEIGRNAFIVVARTATPSGVVIGSPAVVTVRTHAEMPDLEDLLLFGGTIELLISTAPKPADDANPDADPTHTIVADADDEVAHALHRVVVSEIMWGHDASGETAEAMQAGQYIEIYNEGPALLDMDDLRLNFTLGQRVARDEVTFNLAADGTISPDDSGTDTRFAVADRVTMVSQFGGVWAELPGQGGNTAAIGAGLEAIQPTPLVSMYRKRSTTVSGGETTYRYNADREPDGDKFADGTDAAQWLASPMNARANTDALHIGSPGSATVGAGRTLVHAKAPASLPMGSVIINEFNNAGGNSMHWVELHNTSEEDAVQVENWEISFTKEVGKDDDGAVLPKHEIPPMGYLLVVNTDPSETSLTAGTEVPENESDLLGGAQHAYHVDDKLVIPDGSFIILRSANDKNKTHEAIQDVAGKAVAADAEDDGTEIYPLRGWDADDLKDAAGFGMGVWSRTKSEANRLHKDHWENNAYKGGVGYDPKTPKTAALGTPGYPNAAMGAATLKTEDDVTTVTAMPMVVISEIMYDAGQNGDTAQWIELYNPSLSDAVNIGGWTLEVRNKDSQESYVDSMLKFVDDTIILPNQTLLLVSYRDSNDVPANRVYNLWQHHKDDLGLLQRRSILLSPEGFYLKLSYEQADNPDADDDDMILVDEAGNVMIDGAARTVDWALEDAGRVSLVRKQDGADGTAEDSWRMASGVTTHYGDRNDMGSPADHKGSPLPVSLSSFRPVRDKATGQVKITWITESELNNAGFNILRAESKDGEFKVINLQGIIVGHGTTSEKHVYTFTDKSAKPNVVYYYQIEDVSLDGKHTTLVTTHLRGNVNAAGKVTTTWGDLKFQK